MSVRILEIDEVLKLKNEKILSSLGDWIGNMLEGRSPPCLICKEPLRVGNSPSRFVVIDVDNTEAKVWAICPLCDCGLKFEFHVNNSLRRSIA